MFLQNLNWRYATKKMDPTQAVSEDLVDQIVEAVRMAPTSSGLQPFELVVVRNPEVRARLREVGFGQSQFTDGSHVLVFAAWDDYTAERIDAVYQQNVAVRGHSDGVQAYFERLKGSYVGRSAEENFQHAAKQAYIALGFAMAAAAELKVDSTPMEGFQAAGVDEVLGLRELGLRSAVILTLGVRDAEGDWLLPMPKVRKSREEMVRNVD